MMFIFSATLRRLGPRPLRAAIRILVLLLAIAAALPVFPWPWLARTVPALSPWVALCAAVAACAAGLVTLIALPVLLLALLRRRAFCRWVCPTGCAQDLVSRRVRPGAWWLRWPPLGQWIALAALGGAALGIPLLLWLDPLAIFSGFFNALRGDVTISERLAGIGLPLLLLFAFLWPGAWCGKLCPLGGAQDLVSSFVLFSRNRNRNRTENIALGRRVLISAGLGGLWAFTFRKPQTQKPPPLRPPGARHETQFTSLCLRCGNCLRVCPSRVLRPAANLSGLFTPVIDFERDYCREGCLDCIQACPSGALAPLTAQAKRAHVIGRARVDAENCLLAQGRECPHCLSVCPYEALDTSWDPENMITLPAVDPQKCNGCGSCQASCPTTPKSIRVSRV